MTNNRVRKAPARTRRAFLLCACATALIATATVIAPRAAYATDDGTIVFATEEHEDLYAVAGATPDTVETVVEAPVAAEDSSTSSGSETDIGGGEQAEVANDIKDSSDIIDSPSDEPATPADEDVVNGGDLTLHNNDPPSSSDSDSEAVIATPTTDSDNSTQSSTVQGEISQNLEESPISVASDIIYIHPESSVELETQADTPYLLIHFYDGSTNSTTVTAANWKTQKFGSNHDYIYMDSKYYNAIYGTNYASNVRVYVGTVTEFTDDKGNVTSTFKYVFPTSGTYAKVMPKFYRYGYTINGFHFKAKTGQYMYYKCDNTIQAFAQIPTTGTDAYASYGSGPDSYQFQFTIQTATMGSKIINEINTNGNETTYEKTGNSIKQTGSGNNLLEIDPDIYPGYKWYYAEDPENGTGINDATYTVGRGYSAVEGAKGFDSSNDIWDVIVRVLGLKPENVVYDGSTDTFSQYITRTASLFSLYAALDTSSTDTFSVTYHPYNGSYTSSSTPSATSLVISGLTSTTTTTIKASSNGFSSPTTPAGTDWVFDGWYTNSDGTGTKVAEGAALSSFITGTPSGNYDLYAVWKAITYNVSYNKNADGAAYATPDVHQKSYTTTSGNLASASDAGISYSKTGYTITFKEWNTKADGTGDTVTTLADVLGDDKPTDATTVKTYDVYAIWQETELFYHVTYDKGSSDTGTTTTLDYSLAAASGTNVAPSASNDDFTFTKAGYAFAGWSKSSAATSVDIAATTDFSTALTSAERAAGNTVTLYPVWTEREYTVIFAEKYSGTNPSAANPINQVTSRWKEYSGQKISDGTQLASLLGTDPGNPTSTSENSAEYNFKAWYLTNTSTSATWKAAQGSSALGTKTLRDVLNTTGALVINGSSATSGNYVVIWATWESSEGIVITYDTNQKGSGLRDTSGTLYDTNTTFTTENAYTGRVYNIYNGDPSEPSFTGYTFLYWSTTRNDAAGSTHYDATGVNGSSTMTPTGAVTLYAIWRSNSVTFKLEKNTTETADLHDITSSTTPTKSVADSVSLTELVGSTPTRAGYTFKGFSLESASTSPIVVADGTDLTILPSYAPNSTSANVVTLYAQWEKLTYTLRFVDNKVSTDNKNSVSFDGGAHTTTSYLDVSGLSLDDSNLTSYYSTAGGSSSRPNPQYGESQTTGTWMSWYNWYGWGTSSTATGNVASTTTVKDLWLEQIRAANPADSSLTDDELFAKYSTTIVYLYARWSPKTIKLTYSSSDTNKGTVLPTTVTDVNLATGENIQSSTATPATGYQLAKPTWQYVNEVNGSHAIDDVASNATTATYEPSLTALHLLYKAGYTEEAAFIALFEAQTYGYTVEYYLQNADGSYTTNASGAYVPTTTISSPGGYDLTGKFGDTIAYDTEIAGGSYTGTTLWEFMLDHQTYTGTTINNRSLFTLDRSYTDAILSKALGATAADNVLRLFYARKTYDLAAEYSGAPKGVDPVSASDLLTGKKTGVRWGETTAVGSPVSTSYDGYDFAWSSSVSGSSVSSGSFTLSPEAMQHLNSGDTVTLTGTFTEKTFTITFSNGTTLSGDKTQTWLGWGSSDLANGATASIQTTRTTTQPLGSTFIPNHVGTREYEYYFVGWHDSDDTDNPTSTVSVADLADPAKFKNWTKDKTYVALWLEKVTVSYQVGDKDLSTESYKGAWTSGSIKITPADMTNLVIKGSGAEFENAMALRYGSNSAAYLDADGNPLANPGWKFSHWELQGSSTHYGHIAGAFTNGPYHNGTGNSGISISGNGITLIAHWEYLPQTIKINATGEVSNNSSVYGSATGDLTITATPNTTDSYDTIIAGNTDYPIDLSKWSNTSSGVSVAPAGFTLRGWTDVEYGTVVKYSTSETVYVPYTTDASGNMIAWQLWPVFEENIYTITYTVATSSTGRGSVSPTDVDSVYAYNYNTVTAHTANSSDATQYEFSKWTTTDDASATAAYSTATITPSFTTPLTGNITYYAHFTVRQYQVIFKSTGVLDDGSATGKPAETGKGAYVYAGTSGAGVNNDLTLDYHATIPTTGTGGTGTYGVYVEIPEGYYLAGWLENYTSGDTINAVTYDNASITPTESNLQGIYAFMVNGDITLTPYFKINPYPNYRVYYDYGTSVSGYTGTQLSREVTWDAQVLPNNPDDLNPAKAGYRFDGWYWKKDPTTNTLSQIVGSNTFNTIYTSAGATTTDGTDGNLKSITIFAKWTAKSDFNVIFDVYGNVADDTSTTLDNVASIDPKTGITWNTTVAGLGVSDPTRSGYVFGGWYSTVEEDNGSIKNTSNGEAVNSTDTYGSLTGPNGGNDKYTTVTLHAIWTPETYDVLYVFGDGVTSPKTVSNIPYTADRNYYLGYKGFNVSGNPIATDAPTWDGHKFKGWAVSYDTSSETGKPGTTITKDNPTTNYRAIVLRDGSASGLTLTAQWEIINSYSFRDVKVYRDGSDHAVSTSEPEEASVGTSISYSSYTPTTYDGYDFDNHQTSAYNWSAASGHAATAETKTLTDAYPFYFDVYYIERAYTVTFETGTTTYSTQNNPWESDVITLPGATPTKDGCSFGGWFITIDGVDYPVSGNSVKNLYGATSNIPAAGIVAWAKWLDDEAVISWNTDTTDVGGSVAYADSSVSGNLVTVDASDSSSAVKAITATPDTNYDFMKWTYSYTIDGVEYTGDVTSSSIFADLGNPDSNGRYLTLTPKPWILGSDSAALWHSIEFTAHFMPASSLPVTVYHIYEYVNGGSDDSVRWAYASNGKNQTVTDSSTDGATYTAAPINVEGYTLNSSQNGPEGNFRQSGETYAANSGSLVFYLYYTANRYNVTYRYVLPNQIDSQTKPNGAPDVPASSTRQTGETFTVADAPEYAGWTFTGWYPATGTGSDRVVGPTAYDGTDYDMGATDVEFVGTWTRNSHTIIFRNSTGNAGSVTSSKASYSVYEGMNLKLTYGKSTLSNLGVTVSDNGQAIAHSGWRVIGEDSTVLATVGISDPLTYTMGGQNLIFEAIWTATWDVQYTRGDHGLFWDTTDTSKTRVEWDGVSPNAPFSSYYYYVNGTTVKGSIDSATNKPNTEVGWEFVGWYETYNNTTYYYFDKNGDGSINNSDGEYEFPTNVNRNYEFVAYFLPITNTVVFSDTPFGGNSATDAGTWKSGVTPSASYATGDDVAMLAADSLTRDGYTLTGWRYAEQTGTDATTGDPIYTFHNYSLGSTNEFQMPGLASGSTVTLYPVWSLITVDIAYAVASDSYVNSNPTGGISRTSDVLDETHTIQGSTASAYAGYVFAGWSKDADATIISTDATYVPTASGTYYAHFTTKPYTFIYDDGFAQAGSDVASLPTVPTPAAGAGNGFVWTETVNLGTPTRPGYSFEGWDVYESSKWDASTNTGTDRIHEKLAAGDALISAIADADGNATSLVLVARWAAENQTLTYVLNGNGTWNVSNLPSDQQTAPNDPIEYATAQTIELRDVTTVSKPGYTFIGWSTTENDTTATYTFGSNGKVGMTMPAASVLLYPVWQANTYYVYFVPNDGGASDVKVDDSAWPTTKTNPVTNPVEYEGSIAFGEPTRSGYDFTGWYVYDANDWNFDSTDAATRVPTSMIDGAAAISGANPISASTLAKLYSEIAGSPDVTGLVFVATWEARDFTVTYTLGSYEYTWNTDKIAADQIKGTNPATSIGYKTGATVNMRGADTLTRAGYTLVGWRNGTDNTQDGYIEYYFNEADIPSDVSYTAVKQTSFLMPSGDVLLYPVWKIKNDYAVKFQAGTEDTDGNALVGTVNGMPTPAEKGGLTWTSDVAMPELSLTGYSFKGWYIYDTEGKLVEHSNGDPIYDWATYRFDALAARNDVPERKTLTAVAVWELVKTYEVSYLPGVDDSEASKVTLPADQTGTNAISYFENANHTAPKRLGYEFKGWTVKGYNKAGTEVTITQTATLEAGSTAYGQLAGSDIVAYLVMTANWEQRHDYAVKFVDYKTDDDHKDVTPTNMPYEPTKAKTGMAWDDEFDAAAPSRDGYRFDHWAMLNTTTVKDIDTAPAIGTLVPGTESWTYIFGNVAYNVTEKAFDDNITEITFVAFWEIITPKVAYQLGDDADASWVTAKLPTSEQAAPEAGYGHDVYSTVDLRGNDTVSKIGSKLIGWTVGTTNYYFSADDKPADDASAVVQSSFTMPVMAANETLVLTPLWKEITDYKLVLNGNGGALATGVEGAGSQTKIIDADKWNSKASTEDGFSANNADWARTGYTIDYWYYEAEDASQVRVDFDGTKSFADIARGIYGATNVTGLEGIAAADGLTFERPVTLFAHWIERTDYKIDYDNAYDGTASTGVKVADVALTDKPATADADKPGMREGVAWSATVEAPESTSNVWMPGAGTGSSYEQLYKIEGWDYMVDGVRKPAEGKTFSEIAAEVFGEGNEPTDSTITLLARWAELPVTLTYTAVTYDETTGAVVTTGAAGGTVNRSSETVSAVSGGTLVDTKLTAEGATATANAGYHFVGWMRVSDGKVIYAPAGLSTASIATLFAMADETGKNTFPDALTSSLLQVMRNDADGYWHSEEYYALFAENEAAKLSYDKNSDEATGTIDDVNAPYGSIIELSDGTGFTRTNWHITEWNTAADGTGTSYALGLDTYELPEGETTLFAIWAKDAARLTYDANGGTGAPKNYEGVWGDEVTVDGATPKRMGYTFTGWLGSDGKTYEAGESFELVPGGVTLTAQWEINSYTVSHGTPTAGGTVSGGPATIEFGGYVPKGTFTAKPNDGYKLTGWTYTVIDDDGNIKTGTVSDPSELKISGTVTFTPVFEKIETSSSTNTKSGSYSASDVAAAGALPQTGDEATSPAAFAIAGMALLLIALVARRREDREESQA